MAIDRFFPTKSKGGSLITMARHAQGAYCLYAQHKEKLDWAKGRIKDLEERLEEAQKDIKALKRSIPKLIDQVVEQYDG